MTDCERARSLLTGDRTCVLVRGGEVLSSSERGIRPMMTWIGDGTDLTGFSVADRIVGKAAAMLFCKAGIVAVWGDVMSESAAGVLREAGIPFACETRTSAIINRAGTGPCPMEAAVEGIRDPGAAYLTLRETLERMRK